MPYTIVQQAAAMRTRKMMMLMVMMIKLVTVFVLVVGQFVKKQHTSSTGNTVFQ